MQTGMTPGWFAESPETSSERSQCRERKPCCRDFCIGTGSCCSAHLLTATPAVGRGHWRPRASPNARRWWGDNAERLIQVVRESPSAAQPAGVYGGLGPPRRPHTEAWPGFRRPLQERPSLGLTSAQTRGPRSPRWRPAIASSAVARRRPGVANPTGTAGNDLEPPPGFTVAHLPGGPPRCGAMVEWARCGLADGQGFGGWGVPEPPAAASGASANPAMAEQVTILLALENPRGP